MCRTHRRWDCSHSLIEKNIGSSLKCGPVCVPSQYAALISAARKNGGPFKVHKLDHDSFLDLCELSEQTAVNFTVDVSE